MISSSPPKAACAEPAAVCMDRDVANERLIDRMMLMLASGVLTLVLATSVGFQIAGAVDFALPFYATIAGYLAVTLACSWLIPRLATERDLDRLRSSALAITAAAMLSISYFLGGLNWIGVLPLFFLLFGSAFTPNQWRASAIALVGIGGFVALASLEGAGVLPAQDPLDGAVEPLAGAQLAATVAYTALALSLFFVMSGVIAFLLTLQRDALSSMTQELERSTAALADLNAGLEERIAEKTRELEVRYREQHVMAEIGKIVNASLDIDQVYIEFINEARKLLPFDQASIAVFQRDHGKVRLLRGLIVDGIVNGMSFELEASRSLSVSGKAQIFPDFSKVDERWIERSYLLETGAVCGMSVPIHAHDVALGSFNVVSNTPGAYDAHHLELMARIAEPLALAAENARLYDEMRAIADTDGLTGLPNRRALERSLDHEIARAARNGQQCSVLVMDIDNFKTFNDTLGHQAGDDLLVKFAAMLRDTCRDADIVGRQSGDEFTVVLPETRSEEAFTLAQRIHEAVARADWKYPGERGTAVTTSIGIATHPYDDSSEAMLSRADSAMYIAKGAGGGQTRLSSEIVDDEPASGRRQVRFALVEALAGPAADRMTADNAHSRTLAAFTGRAAVQIAERLGCDDGEQRTLRVAAMSHALGIFPQDDPYGEDNAWGLDPNLDDIYLKLGRLFVAASPGLDETLHAVFFHHRDAARIAEPERKLSRVLAVAEAYARLTMPGAEPQLPPASALTTLRDDATLDQAIVDSLAGAVEVETQGRAA